MNSIIFAIAVTFFLMIANGFFAAAEIAIVSARHSRLHQQADAGKRGAQQALNLAKTPDRFLATVQIGMTLINTLAAAFSGASLSAPLAEWIRQVPWLAAYAGPLSLGIVVVLVTYFELIIAELVPKRLALQSAENVAANSAPFMTSLSRIAAPVVSILNGSVNLVLRLLGRHQTAKEKITEEDIVYLTHEGIMSGTVERGEEELISRVFRFTDRNISDVMKPRTEMIAIEVGTPRSQAVQTFMESGYTRIPLYQDSLDNIVGVLYAKDLLKAHPNSNQEQIDLLKLARPPFFVSEYQHVNDLLATFRRRRIHLAIVIDEYSQVVGLITLEDVLEELVGEIQDEYDQPEDNSIVQREDGSWLVDGMLDREVVKEKIGLQPSLKDEDNYHTLAGMILNATGRIPAVGDTITIGDFTLEIMDMDGRRIDRVLVRRKKPV